MIISISRRTDVPAFYMSWLMQRIHAGKVVYYNPFNFKGYEISLKPEDVDVLFFISKNFAPLLPYLDELQAQYNLYFHYTITGLSGVFEELVPPAPEMVRVFQEIARRTSPRQIAWRFDPIVLTNMTPPEFYREKFRELAAQLAGSTERCYLSFATVYDKMKRTFQQLEERKGVVLLATDQEERRQLADELASLAAGYGMKLFSCCNDFLQSDLVAKGRCVDGEYLSELFHLQKRFPAYPTREGCGCARCVDIGAYDTCPHGCSYCYANVNKQVATRNYQAHSPAEELLARGKIEVVKRLPADDGQLSLF